MTYPADRKITPELAETLESEVEEPEPEVTASIDLTEFAPEVTAIHAPSADGVDNREPDYGEPVQPQDSLTGGDRDVDPYLAEVVGEEAIGGTTPTPDQNVIEDLATSAGIETADREILHTSEILERRDARRWELDPESSEDYQQHQLDV